MGYIILLQLNWRSATCTQKINLPVDQKGYCTSENNLQILLPLIFLRYSNVSLPYQEYFGIKLVWSSGFDEKATKQFENEKKFREFSHFSQI